MEVTKEQVCELARICRLTLTSEEAETFSGDLTALEALTAPLLSVQTAPHVAPAKAIDMSQLREDRVVKPLSRNALLSAAARIENGCFVVPPTWEDPS